MQFALHELERLLPARFGKRIPRYYMPCHFEPFPSEPCHFEPEKDVHLIEIFSLAAHEAKQANNARFAGILTKVCSEEVFNRLRPTTGNLSFYHESTSNRGWLSNEKELDVLLIDFNRTSILMVRKSLCSLEPTDTGQTNVRVKGPREGDDGIIWVRDATLELCNWLSRYVLGS